MEYFESYNNHCSIINKRVSTTSKYFGTGKNNTRKIISFSCSNSDECNITDDNECELFQEAYNKYR
ncbi:hypothetical protein C4Z54_17175 [Clostridioides difficile]|uniref:hypothetical protein n=1 Tax=Clostridioides difficile TaxID=1496 RepID=UPI0010342338|nr:hypothetical protein [Clostridioides difficile]MCU5810227.1 hypothetical protein [Clostridioides difficile]MDB2727197.1 hypothetical protein [Clostridioides difficile]MDB2763064.1 hypothetical protein [Clostridioides difficile]MDB3099354.1 hypothetical protein [Clostridioides difficile]MDN9385430.1 hypothetical protein [Clostridioides difficile]